MIQFQRPLSQLWIDIAAVFASRMRKLRVTTLRATDIMNRRQCHVRSTLAFAGFTVFLYRKHAVLLPNKKQRRVQPAEASGIGRVEMWRGNVKRSQQIRALVKLSEASQFPFGSIKAKPRSVASSIWLNFQDPFQSRCSTLASVVANPPLSNTS